MSGSRADRVADLIRRNLAQTLREGLRDPRVGFVTLTHVKLSPDLRNAVVFVTVMGEEQRDSSLQALNRASGFFRSSLAREAGLRFTPHLRFVLDDAVESGQRVEAILDGLRQEDGAADD